MRYYKFFIETGAVTFINRNAKNLKTKNGETYALSDIVRSSKINIGEFAFESGFLVFEEGQTLNSVMHFLSKYTYYCQEHVNSEFQFSDLKLDTLLNHTTQERYFEQNEARIKAAIAQLHGDEVAKENITFDPNDELVTIVQKKFGMLMFKMDLIDVENDLATLKTIAPEDMPNYFQNKAFMQAKEEKLAAYTDLIDFLYLISYLEA